VDARPSAIDRLPWEPVFGCLGVRTTDLWRLGHTHDALIAYELGSPRRVRPPLRGSSHLGGVRIRHDRRRRVVAGSYVHVPPGNEHPIADVGPQGCTLLQMHRPVPADR
jgi:hypothetical protein